MKKKIDPANFIRLLEWVACDAYLCYDCWFGDFEFQVWWQNGAALYTRVSNLLWA